MSNQTHTADAQEFKNDTVQVKVTRQPGCRVHLEIMISPEAVQASFAKAIKNVRNEVSIPGFRKGKAPEATVLKNFAAPVEREWRELVLRNGFYEAVSLTRLEPLTAQSISRSSLKKCSKEEGAEAHFDYETHPFIPDVNIQDLQVALTAPKEVQESMVDAEIEKERLRLASTEEITDPEYKVQPGDFVEVDLDVLENPARNVFQSRLFHVSKEHMPDWAYDAILGLKTNESKEVMVAPENADPDHVHSDSCNHDPKQCRILVATIKRGALPVADDTFAKKVGFETIQELRAKVRAGLEKYQENIAADISRSAVANQLLETYSIELPDQLVRAEIQTRLPHVRSYFEQKEGALPEGAKKTSDEELKQQVLSIAYAYLCCLFLTKKIALQNGLKYDVNYNDLMNELMQEQFTPVEHRVIFQGMQPDEVRARLEIRLTIRKTLDWVISQLRK